MKAKVEISAKNISRFVIVLGLSLGAWCQPIDNDLEYRFRGDRSEGIIQPKKSGNSIELMSALVDYQEESSTIPASLAVRFFLKEPTTASVSVRGLAVAQSYWMNNVHPKTNWKTGFGNEFRWPTSAVIQKLKDLKNMYDLGVLVCLGQSCETTDDLIVTVSPAIFYYSSTPRSISAYRFTFKPISHESLTFTLYQDVNGDAKGAPITSQVFSDVDPGVPFNVFVGAPPHVGWYQLQVIGLKRFSKENVSKTVRFYHSPAPAA